MSHLPGHQQHPVILEYMGRIVQIMRSARLRISVDDEQTFFSPKLVKPSIRGLGFNHVYTRFKIPPPLWRRLRDSTR